MTDEIRQIKEVMAHLNRLDVFRFDESFFVKNAQYPP